MPAGGDGQGRAAQGDLRPRRTSATARAASSAPSTTATPTSSAVVDTAHRARGPQAPVGRARGRRDHVQRAAASTSSRSCSAPPGRRDHHPVRLPDLRDARPDQDGLPRAAQPHHPRRRAASTSRPTAARRRPRGRSTLDDEATYELLAPRRHPRRLPARRRPDARAAALDAARQLRGHLRGRRALPARSDGRQLAQQLRPRKNGREPVDADPPRAGRAARGRSSGETYGLIVYQEQVMAIAQKLAGYTLGPGRPAAPRDGQEEEGGARQGVRAASPTGMTSQRLLRGRDQDAVGHPAPVLRLRLQQGALRRLRRWSPTGPAYLKANYPAEYMAALLTVGQGRQGQVGDLPQRVPPDGHQGAAAGRQRVRGQLHPGRHRHPLRPDRDPQRRRQRRRRHRRRRARRRAASPTSTTSWRKVPALVCNKRVIESLIKAGAFDASRRHADGPGRRSTRRPSTRSSTVKRNEAIGQDSPLRRARRRPGGAAGGDDMMGLAPVPEVEWDKIDAAGLRARDARALRLRPSAVRARARPRGARRLPRSARCTADEGGAPDGSMVTVAGLITGARDQDHQEGRPLGDRDGRGPRRAPSSACSSRART